MAIELKTKDVSGNAVGTLALDEKHLGGMVKNRLMHGASVMYQANLRQAKVAQKEFEDKVRRLERQLSQVKVKEAQAEASAALSNVAFKVGDLGDTMKTVEEILNKRYELSAGKARLAKDMVNMDQVQEKENERKALEQAALAEFLASQGIQAASPAAPANVSKQMGPAQQG